MNIYYELFLITIFIAIACAILGPFLILRKMAMMVDAITHTILLGIVIGYLLTKNFASPWLIILASFTGVFTSILMEKLSRVPLIEEDSAIGTIFPLLFSIAIIFISIASTSVHIDTDSVLLGKIEFAAFERFMFHDVDFGAKTMWIGIILCCINAAFIAIFYKELKVTTFDKSYAYGLAFAFPAVQYLFMLMISMTTVASFQVVGSVLVISYLVGPCVTAYIITHDLKRLILYSIGISILNTLIGFSISITYDLSISGTIATTMGFVFALVCFFHPQVGMVRRILDQRKKQSRFLLDMCLFHIWKHASKNDFSKCHIDTMNQHLRLSSGRYQKCIRELQQNQWIDISDHHFVITEKGMIHFKKNFSKMFPFDPFENSDSHHTHKNK